MGAAPIIHVPQRTAFQDQTRHRFFLVGRRGGKTFLIVEEICKDLPPCPDKGEIFYIGPTNSHAMELIWEPIQDRLDELGWDYHARISKQRFELSRGRKIYVIGAEKIRRIRGHKSWRVYMDELAYFEKPLGDVWRAVRPTLVDLKGRALAATTPDMKGSQAYDFWLEAKAKHDWSVHHWTSADNPFIDNDELQEAAKDLDEKSFRSEHEATWESFEGLAYYNFDENIHMVPCEKYWPGLHLDLCLDFNVNPTTLIVAQTLPAGMQQYKREYSLKNSSTEDTVGKFCEDHRDHRGHFLIRIFGDSSGKNRSSTTGKSDYYYVEKELQDAGFSFVNKVLPRNPPIVDRVKHMNGSLKPKRGESRIQIDPGCKDLIKDFGAQGLDGRHPSDKNNLGHKADAVGYHNYWLWFMRQTSKSSQIQL